MDEQQTSTINMPALLADAYRAAPPHIQSFIESGKFESFMGQLQSRLTIHADVANKVSNELLMMLLGLSPGADLPDNLRKEAGVPEELINPILEEVARGIIAPLRDGLRTPPKPTQPRPQAPEQHERQWVQVTPPASPPRPPVVPVPAYTPPARVPSVSVLNQNTTPQEAHPLPARAQPHELIAEQGGHPTTPHTNPTELHEMQERPPMVPDQAPPPPQPAPPRTAPPVPAHLPGQPSASPPPARPPAPPQATYTRPYMPETPSPQTPAMPRVQKSGVDPYREPIE